MDYWYSLYGLSIKSEICVKALTPKAEALETCDLQIRLGRTPEKLNSEPLVKNVCATMAKGEYLFFHKKLGVRFYVKDGRDIIVDEDYYQNPETVSVYLLGSIMGAVLYMRGIIPMHASAVQTEMGAILFCGKSGAGKSTIAHALQQRGYNAITDDVAPIQVINGKPFVHPGYNQFKLWQNSLEMNGIENANYPRIRDSFEKYYVDFHQNAENKPYPLYKIYHLTTHLDTGLLTIKKTDSEERLKIIKNSVFRPACVKGLNRETEQFIAIVSLANLPVSTITRPQKLVGSFEDYTNQIESDLFR